MAYTAAGIGFFTFALGWVVAGFLPEPQFANHEGGDDSDDEDIEEEETTARVLSLMTNRRKNPRTRIPTMTSRMRNRCSRYFSLVP